LPGVDIVEKDALDRIAELEARVAFQDQSISELNDVIVALRDQLDQVEVVANKLRDRLQEASALDGQFESTDQKPPHY